MDIRLTFICSLLFSCLLVAFAEEGLIPIVDTGKVKFLEYKATNVLECNMTVAPGSASNYSIQWLREDQTIEPSQGDHPKYEFKGNKLYIHRTKDEDIVKYTCLLINNKSGSRVSRGDFETKGIPTVKIVSQGTFIEGQKISIECVVTGKPTPTVEWRFGNKTFSSNLGRIELLPSKTIPNAILQIGVAQMSDRGYYTCIASNDASEYLNQTIEFSTFVRVKDKLAALWPFIGICAEVVVLCAIIFIYERKRNKAELDESDTDQSPEQKNTPDHGKESVRQRK